MQADVIDRKLFLTDIGLISNINTESGHYCYIPPTCPVIYSTG